MRRITYDIDVGIYAPRRGDRLRTTKMTYYVLASRQVKRRDPDACAWFLLCIGRKEELDAKTRAALVRSAIRRDGESVLFRLVWYPRKKKRVAIWQ